MGIFHIYLFLIGSSFVSFASVLVYRKSRGETIGWSRSKCNTCSHLLHPLSLIPVVSYLFQKGRCLHCHASIPIRYPLFEFLGGLLLVYSSHVYSDNPLQWGLFLSLFLIALIDQETFVIPDSLQVCVAICFVLQKVHTNNLFTYDSIRDGALALLLIGLAMVWESPRFGGGDLKLIALFLFAGGLFQISTILFVASALGLLAFWLRSLKRKEAWSEPLPFAPYLVFAFIFVSEWLN